jgi:Spherulation-specific family 4/Domain of unknown function (DUF4214)
MLRGFKKCSSATFRKLRRPPARRKCRTTPSFIGLEHRVLLSLKGVDTPVAESIRTEAVGRATHPPEAAKVNKQVKFVDSLYKQYFHRVPDAAELSFALQQMATGVSHKALTADFKAVHSKTGKGITGQDFVTALYATIAGESPTSVGLVYWQGLLASGDSRTLVERRFSASGGLLPPPKVSWVNPANIIVGTPLGPTQLDATASVPGTFTYSPPQGTVLGAGTGEILSVVFRPTDTLDYPIVTDAVSINVKALTPAPTPTPVPTSKTMGIIVPAYFAPGTGGPGGVGDGWAAMDAAAAEVPLTAIFNPNSGPLPGPADPSYVTALTNLEDAGGKVVAYVYTDNGNAALATVEGQISTYITQYGSLINGFMLDGMLVTPNTLSYYQGLYNDIQSLNPSYTVIGNPGQPYLNGVSSQDYLSVADVFNIFEGPNSAPAGSPGYNTYPYGQTWYQSDPSDRFSNTIYDVPADAGDFSQSSAMVADVSQAVQLDTGDVYITDLSGGNPYDALPSYWDQEVSAVAAATELGTSALRPEWVSTAIEPGHPERSPAANPRGARPAQTTHPTGIGVRSLSFKKERTPAELKALRRE